MTLKQKTMNPFKKSLFIAIFFALLTTGVVWHLFLLLSNQRFSAHNYLQRSPYILAGIIAAILALRYAIKFRSKSPMSNVLFAASAGFFVWITASIIWTYLNFTSDITSPNGTIVDALFLLAFAIFAIGTFLLLRSFNLLNKIEYLLEAISAFIVITTAILLPYFALDIFSASTQTRITYLLYFLGGSFIFSLLLVLVRHEFSNLHRNHLFFLLGLIFIITTDLLRAYQSAQETIWSGGQVDLLYAFGTFFISLGIVYTINNEISPH